LDRNPGNSNYKSTNGLFSHKASHVIVVPEEASASKRKNTLQYSSTKEAANTQKRLKSSIVHKRRPEDLHIG